MLGICTTWDWPTTRSLNKNGTSHFVSCVEQIAVIECININFPPDFTNLLDKMQ